ncbi:MAG: hypothetical protein HKL80_03100 [Acidimicrobiales bacterium]|nr:hypothetical protein [Acidimicrobiales bacterium]
MSIVEDQKAPVVLKFRGKRMGHWYKIAWAVRGPIVTLIMIQAVRYWVFINHIVAYAMLVTAFFLFAFGQSLSIMIRPLMVTPETLKLPNFGPKRIIPVSDIAGVGLLYIRPSSSMKYEGWSLNIWRRNGLRHELYHFMAPPSFLSSTHIPLKKLLLLDFRSWIQFPPPNDTFLDLLNTRTGQIAKEIYDFVVSAQGPDGPLITKELQKHPIADQFSTPETLTWWSPRGTILAWWSPDGKVGFT